MHWEEGPCFAWLSVQSHTSCHDHGTTEQESFRQTDSYQQLWVLCFWGKKLSSSYFLNKTGARGIVIHIQASVGDSSLQRDAVASHGTLLFRALWRHNGRELCCRGWVSRGQWPSHLLRRTHVLERTGEELTDFIEPGILEHLLDDFPICYWSSSLRLWAVSYYLGPGGVWA